MSDSLRDTQPSASRFLISLPTHTAVNKLRRVNDAAYPPAVPLQYAAYTFIVLSAVGVALALAKRKVRPRSTHHQAARTNPAACRSLVRSL